MSYYNPENSCQFIGRLGKELKQLDEGRYTFTTAVRNWKNKEEPTWVMCFVAGQSAEYLRKYAKVGDMLILTCQYITWKGKDGTYRHGFDVVQASKVGNASTNGASANSSREDREERPSERSTERPPERTAPPVIDTPRNEPASEVKRPSQEMNEDDMPPSSRPSIRRQDRGDHVIPF